MSRITPARAERKEAKGECLHGCGTAVYNHSMKTSFYRAEHIAALRDKNRKWNAVFTGIAVLTLLGVIVCAACRTTLNAARTELLAISVLTVGGWAAIAVWDCAIRPNRVLREHEERILSSEEGKREVHGIVTLDAKAARIVGSVNVRGVRVQTEEGPVRLLVSEDFAPALRAAAADGELTLSVTEGYVTGVAP